MVRVELDKLLHAVYLFIHLCSDESAIFFIPLPQSDVLLGRRMCFRQGDDHGAIFVDVKRNDSFWVRVEDGLAWGARADVPDNQHRIFPHVCGDDDVEGAVVGNC